MSGQGRRILSSRSIFFVSIAILLAVGFFLPFERHKPAIHLPAAEVFNIAGFPISNSVIATWVTMAVLLVIGILVTRRMKLVPGRLQAAFEMLLGMCYGLCESIAGEKWGRKFFPIVVTIFLFVLFNAWLSLFPGFGSLEVFTGEHEVELLRGANTDINTPLAIALISFFCVEFFGLRAHGVRYLSEFFNFGPLFRSIGQIITGKVKSGLNGLVTGFILLFVGILELFSHFVRILSFTLRLFGNMTAGEILILIVVFLVPFTVVTVFYGLELFVGFIQALIFSILTLVFLTLATAHHGE
ncbi:MAG: F0F1 ATP synthase subunit A [Dehalococcoidales bacterium]|nr:F0F1 ATP synthase subunit A [Dehalococcoidales bacterium]